MDRTVEEFLPDLLKTALGLCLQADQEAIEKFEALVDMAKEGDPVAKRTLRHPWMTSEDPGKKVKALKKSLAENQAKMGALLGETLPILLSISRTADLLRDFENSQSARVVPSDAIDRLREKLKKAGATDSLIDRASHETMQLVIAMMRERALPTTASNQQMLQTLERLNLVGLVAHIGAVPINKALAKAASEGCAGAAEIIPMEETEPTFWTVIPVALNATRFPADYEDWKMKSMVPSFWDGIGDSPFYKVTSRALDKAEPNKWRSDDECLPAYLTYDEIYKHEPRLRKHHLDAEEEARLLSSYRELLTTEDLDEDTTISVEAHDEVLDYCFQNEDLYRDRTAWDVWTQWRIMFEAIKRFIEETYSELPDDHVVSVWLYLLAGRLASSEGKLPALHRRLLFDWLELPVTFSKVPTTRYLVPVSVLQATGPDDPVLRPHLETLQFRIARIEMVSKLRIKHAEEAYLRKLVNQRLAVIRPRVSWAGQVDVPWQEIRELGQKYRTKIGKLYPFSLELQSSASQSGASAQPNNIVPSTDGEEEPISQRAPVIPAAAVVAETEKMFLNEIDELLLTAVAAVKNVSTA